MMAAMSSRRWFRVLLVTLAVTAPILAACSDTTARDNELDPEEELDQAVEELVAMPGGPPGAIVVAQRGSDRTVHTAGVAELGTDEPPDARGPHAHRQRGQSLQRGDGAVPGRRRSDVARRHDRRTPSRAVGAWGDVTVRQLLNHTSGLPDFTDFEVFAEAVVASLEEALPPAELVAFVRDEPLEFPPGTEYHYSNTDNIVVGLMIEAATGQSYVDVLTEEVLEPLGLDDTSLPTGTELPEPYIHGYQIDDEGQYEDVTNIADAQWSWASGGIVSTPEDLNDFIRGYVSGELYSDEVRDEQQDLFIPAGASEPNGPGDNSATMSLFRYQTECGTVYGHSGNTSGYTQFAVASPDGRRSATISISLQRTQKTQGQKLDVYTAQKRVWDAAICFIFE